MSDRWTISLPTFDVCLSANGRYEVNEASALDRRNALEQFARYFKAEFRYDHIQYFANEHDETCIGFLFTESALDICTEDHDQMPTRCSGGCCFRRREYKNAPQWTLDWIWLHPFFRHRGILSTHWRHFQAQFGNFSVEPPLSSAMQAFLKKHV